MPVEYSPLITSTPSTPSASCAKWKPAVLTSTGLKVRRSLGLIEFQWAICTAAMTMPSPAMPITATSSDQRVDRSDHSFVHSDLITCSCVTLPIAMRGRS